MHTQRELIALAASKAALRRRIAAQRAQCAGAIARAAEPLAWLDSALASWRKLSPWLKFAALPLGVLLNRTVAPRSRVLGTLLRWGPLVFGAVRGLAGARSRAARG
jgi:hypothetical protein